MARRKSSEGSENSMPTREENARHLQREEAIKASAADRGNDVAIKFQAGKIKKADLYDRFCEAGLSPEEADEMCNLMEQDCC